VGQCARNLLRSAVSIARWKAARVALLRGHSCRQAPPPLLSMQPFSVTCDSSEPLEAAAAVVGGRAVTHGAPSTPQRPAPTYQVLQPRDQRWVQGHAMLEINHAAVVVWVHLCTSTIAGHVAGHVD